MSKNYNRARYNKANNGRNQRILLINNLFPIYWDEGIFSIPKYRKGYKNPNKWIGKYKRRSYKTWKYNRKTKWKNTN